MDGRLIERHLGGALSRPLFEWPESLAGVRTQIRIGDYAGALSSVRDLAKKDEALVSWIDEVRKLVASRVRGLKSAQEAGDHAEAWRVATLLEAGVKGLPEEREVAAIRKSLQDDPESEAIREIQRDVRELRARPTPSKTAAQDVVADLVKLAESHPDTIPARDARDWIAWLELLVEQGYLK